MTTQIQGASSDPVGESATEPLAGVSSPYPQVSDRSYEWPASAEARLLEALMQLEGGAVVVNCFYVESTNSTLYGLCTGELAWAVSSSWNVTCPDCNAEMAQ